MTDEALLRDIDDAARGLELRQPPDHACLYATIVLARCRKAIAAALSTVAPPREPNDAMLTAGCDAFLARNEDRFVIFAADVVAVWRAMYDAASLPSDKDAQ
jgi:hypothetical protein